jgi:hypothetical protein
LALEDRLRLRRGAWRYTLLPGLAELDLARRLEAVPGASVELWPQRDRYDLLIRLAGSEWRVDVKDWTDGGSLAESLRQRPVSGEAWIVVPDNRKHQVGLLEERCSQSGWRFATATSLLHLIESAARSKP